MCDTVRRIVFILMLIIAGVVVPSSARATDVWTRPYSGVKVLHRTGNGMDVHLVLIDLHNPDVSIVATRPEDRFITTSAFAARYDAQVAINANFYNHGSCGLMVGDGALMNSYEDGCTASLAFGDENESKAFDSTSIPHGPVPEQWMRQVLSGKPFLIRNGRPMTNWVRPQHLYRPNPRTAVGVSRDRGTMVMLIADGRRRGVPGLTGFEMVRLFLEFDVADAINLDGGGSTALVVGGRVRNQPSDKHERSVVSHLGIRVRPGHPWVRGSIVRTSGEVRVTEGESAELWVEAENVGRATWKAGTSNTLNHGAPRLVIKDSNRSYEAELVANTAPGATARWHLSLPSAKPGTRVLDAHVIFPDGTRKHIRSGAMRVVTSARPRVVRPAHGSRRAAGMVRIPPALGVVFAGAQGPLAELVRRRPRLWFVMGVSILGIAALWLMRARRRSQNPA